MIITYQIDNNSNNHKIYLPRIITLDPSGYWGPYNLINNAFLPTGTIGISINLKPIISNLTDNFKFQNYLSNPNDLTIYHFVKDLKFNINNFNTVTELLNYQLKYNIHSPRLGFMYDGLPIYGPLGFSENNQQTVKVLESSYNANHKFEIGKGDLDICNGIFCPTQEYPKGIYHYHFTIKKNSNNQIITDNKKNFIPEFPFNIGLFKGIPEIRNFFE